MLRHQCFRIARPGTTTRPPGATAYWTGRRCQRPETRPRTSRPIRARCSSGLRRDARSTSTTRLNPDAPSSDGRNHPDTTPSSPPATTPVTAPSSTTDQVDQADEGVVAPRKMTTMAGGHPAALAGTHLHGCRTAPRSAAACTAPSAMPDTSPRPATASAIASSPGCWPSPPADKAAGADSAAQPSRARRRGLSPGRTDPDGAWARTP